MRRLGEDHAGRVGADVAGDARQDVDPGAGVGRQVRARRRGSSTARSVASANGAEPSGIGSMPSSEVMHDRVADDRQLEDRVALDPGPVRELGEEPVERLRARPRVISPAPAVVHHRVADPAHQVLAEPDLRVHHAGAGEDRAVAEVREVAGDRRRADVDRDAVRLLVQARPDAGDRRACRGPRP